MELLNHLEYILYNIRLTLEEIKSNSNRRTDKGI